MLTLANDRFVVVLNPEVGGSIASFRLSNGTPVFCDARDRPDADATDSACFPMVPFCNRVKDNVFEAGDRRIELKPNTRDRQRVAHGFGWRSAWTIAAMDDQNAVLRHEYHAADWPWSYVATQSISITATGLRVILTLTNGSDTAMPAGLGLHPYFLLHTDTRLRFFASDVHELNTRGFPSESADGEQTLRCARNGQLSPLIGNRYFDGVTGFATISQPEAAHVVLMRSNAKCVNYALHVEKEKSLFCLEPMTHAVGALGVSSGVNGSLSTLSSNETMELIVEWSVKHT